MKQSHSREDTHTHTTTMLTAVRGQDYSTEIRLPGDDHEQFEKEKMALREELIKLTNIKLTIEQQLKLSKEEVIEKDGQIKKLKNTNTGLHDEIDELNEQIFELKVCSINYKLDCLCFCICVWVDNHD